MDEQEVQDLAKYRLEQSKENLEERVSEARFLREKSDYVDFYIVTKDECKTQIETAKLMIEDAEKYINKKLNK